MRASVAPDAAREFALLYEPVEALLDRSRARSRRARRDRPLHSNPVANTCSCRCPWFLRQSTTRLCLPFWIKLATPGLKTLPTGWMRNLKSTLRRPLRRATCLRLAQRPSDAVYAPKADRRNAPARLLRLHAYSNVVNTRAPLAPIGWPSATAPPCTFTREGSMPSSRRTATA